jgi:hypothetical protein
MVDNGVTSSPLSIRRLNEEVEPILTAQMLFKLR